MNLPLRFEPFLRPMVWGGRALAESLGKPLPADGPYGESWEVSDHASHHSRVAHGPHAGQTLRDLMERDAPLLLGEAAGRHAVFPWLVKFLDARDRLSVQVHPGEEEVKRLWPGEGSKTEAWFILSAEPGAQIHAGLLPGVDEGHFREALVGGRVESLLHVFHPRPGDCVFLPAGTVHAVGGGVLLAEVQQTSDATFRLYDWDRRDAEGRSRTLHIEEALACIDWQQGPVAPVRAEDGPRLVECPYFTLDYHREDSAFSLGGTGRMQVLIAVEGRGVLETAEGPMSVRAGETLLLPAALPALTARPEPYLAFLLATLPGADR
jgi:mannose-6-phosphate isomerase